MKTENGINYLRQLVSEGEGIHLEFKLKTSHPDKIMREVVAFANTEGGKLLVGVADDGELRGLKFPDEDRYVIHRALARYVTPEIDFSEKEIALENGRSVLIFCIRKNEDALVYFQPEGDEQDQKIYVRNKDRSIQASKEVKQILKERLKSKHYRFGYGEKETALMKYLDQHPFITISEFKNVAGITTSQASQTLVLLVLAGVLKITPEETEDRYSLI